MTSQSRQVVCSPGLPWPLASRSPYWTLIGSVPEALVPTAGVGMEVTPAVVVTAQLVAVEEMVQLLAAAVEPQAVAVGTVSEVVERTEAAEQAAVRTDDQPSKPQYY